MDAVRDKVTEKLSHLFADSPNQSPSPGTPRSNSPQARPNSNAEKSLSSYFSFIIPSINSDGSNPDNHCPDSEVYQPLPIRRESYDFDEDSKPDRESQKKYKDKIINPTGENKQLLKNKDDECGDSGRSNVNSDIFEDATDQLSPAKLTLNLTDESAFLSHDLYRFLQASLPNLVRGCKWILLYSTLKHGISLRTLIRKSSELPGPCLLITGDKPGAVFGAMLECPLTPTPKRKYQGTNQTFVFTTLYGEPRLFRPTGVNRYYYMCLNDFLAFGGGGNFALWLDGDLLSGSSGPCDTFGNECLARNPEFELKNVELWGFAYASEHLS